MKKQANQSKKSFKPTPIPHRTKFGEPMAYYTLSDDGKIHTEVSRSVCLAHTDETDNPFPQRWYVDEESGLVVRLPLYWSTFLVTLCSEFMLHIELPSVSYTY